LGHDDGFMLFCGVGYSKFIYLFLVVNYFCNLEENVNLRLLVFMCSMNAVCGDALPGIVFPIIVLYLGDESARRTI